MKSFLKVDIAVLRLVHLARDFCNLWTTINRGSKLGCEWCLQHFGQMFTKFEEIIGRVQIAHCTAVTVIDPVDFLSLIDCSFLSRIFI